MTLARDIEATHHEVRIDNGPVVGVVVAFGGGWLGCTILNSPRGPFRHRADAEQAVRKAAIAAGHG
jgi:hypothetical protein